MDMKLPKVHRCKLQLVLTILSSLLVVKKILTQTIAIFFRLTLENCFAVTSCSIRYFIMRLGAL